jgi:hypothetical protein
MAFRGHVVIVTGSTEWTDEEAIRVRLKLYSRGVPILLHGNASGADRISAKIGRELGFQVLGIQYFADLGALGGHARNRLLVNLGSAFRTSGMDVAVEAFPLPSSRGTWNCIEIATMNFLPTFVLGVRQ